MAGNSDHKFSDISSFEDFRLEKERLILKSKLAESKIDLDIFMIRRAFSVSNLILSFAREFILPKLTFFLGDLSKKVENKPNS
jgi:hypothetical protein